MSEEETFPDLIGRVRAGHQDAMTELVRLYEPAILRTVRKHMKDKRMRRVHDSNDICQSVLKSLMKPNMLDRLKLETAEDLMRLLTVMTKNKVVSKIRYGRSLIRDYRRLSGDDIPLARAAAGMTPAQQAECKELYELAKGYLSDKEIAVWELRDSGMDWDRVAKLRKSTPEAERKKLKRAFQRVRDLIDVVDLPGEAG